MKFKLDKTWQTNKISRYVIDFYIPTYIYFFIYVKFLNKTILREFHNVFFIVYIFEQFERFTVICGRRLSVTENCVHLIL